jgi:hypothetical protein
MDVHLLPANVASRPEIVVLLQFLHMLLIPELANPL